MTGPTFVDLWQAEWLNLGRRWLHHWRVLALCAGLVALLLAAEGWLGGRLGGPSFLLYMLPFATTVITFGLVHREWSNHTAGWWLTLPVPRSWLLGVKWLCGVTVALLLYALFWLVAGVWWLAVAASGPEHADATVRQVWESFLICASYTPLLVSWGLLLGVTTHGRWWLAKPLLWACYGLLGDTAIWLTIAVQHAAAQEPAWVHVLITGLPVWLALTWLAAAAVFGVSVRIMAAGVSDGATR
ncbi:hypothetical protein GCM10010885_09970 [Alicyclobacillus cellulosilyticus]|uniref:Uncharacterized protein n=1 Tax=Alicyclobacillus cellulosilyticus TaxID=1003997 RepID=A0A917NI89_9BACL|nr:hypothetical protein [Alicyclobacillus cellulosilyticus]GGJ02679.1 hypothetical protein GCM10010885_09970 [Alicyclobacillus cellulosilyticus]